MEDLTTKFINTSEARFQATVVALRNNEASIHNLKNQIGQLANLVFERPLGTLPSNTETNPREQVKAITLRGRKELQEINEKKVEDKK